MSKKIFEVVIIGGGISGLIALKHFKASQLNVVLLEKQSEVGGLWNRLPYWQDIQSTAMDWTFNNIPIEGVTQKSIQKNIQSLVNIYNLHKYIKLSTTVSSLEKKEEVWTVHTNKGDIFAKNVVCCSGLHNTPNLPSFKRESSNVQEIHSSQFANPKVLESKRVTIIGGGASAYDLLELAFKYKAKEVHWVYRSTKWMFPTTKSKHEKANLRFIGHMQMRGSNPNKMSKLYNDLLAKKYAHFGLNEIIPKKSFDFSYDQLVPGRKGIINNFNRIKRYESEIKLINANSICLVNNKSIDTDYTLYGTGYNTELSFLGLTEYNNIKDSNQLRENCYSHLESIHYSNLYFMGGTFLDGNGAGPINLAMVAQTLTSIIKGKVNLPQKIIKERANHWDILKYFATFDRDNYTRFWWRIKYFMLTRYYLIHPKLSINFDQGKKSLF